MLPEFAHPWFLLLLLLVPPVLWWHARRRRNALRFPAVAPLAGLPVGRSRWAHRGGLALRGAALVLLIVGLAGPRWPDPGTRIPTEGIALVMVVDVSGSMGETDFQWQGVPVTRLEAVKRAFRLFVEGGDAGPGRHLPGRKNDLVGMVTFATNPESACPLTLSHGALLKLLDAERPRVGADVGRTNVGDAIAWGLYRLRAAGDRRKVMILLTDGEHNVPDVLRPRQSAQLAGNLGVPIYTIDVGSDQPADGEGLDAEKQKQREQSAAERLAVKKVMDEVARITGGRSFHATDLQALADVYAEIDRLERRPIETFQYRRYDEGYPWFGLAAFVCLVLAVGLEATVWRRVP